MKMLDLFSGLNGWNAPFKERGHDVVTLDFDPDFNADYQKDILDINDLDDLGGPFDIITASPPCETFSVASIGTHWTGGFREYIPATKAAENGLKIVNHLFSLLYDAEKDEDKARFWIVENPRGVMRKIAPYGPWATVWYCQVGDTRAKPTDIWLNDDLGIPWETLTCRNNNPDCDHERAPRGAKTGTQGIEGSAGRAMIPYGLALLVCEAAEGLHRG